MASAPRHLRIFLASPGDVGDEREIALQVLDNLPYDPLLLGKVTIQQVAWDKRGAGAPILAGVTPQDSIAAGLPRPGECDIVVVIFWSRMGTPLPPSYQKEDGSRYESGTAWEYEDAVASFRQGGSPYVLLYRRKQTVLLDPDDPRFDERRDQYEKVKRFFAGLQNADGSANGGYTEYGAPSDFRDRLENDLKHFIARILDTPTPATSLRVPLPEPWRGSPFPGLRAFTAADAPIFFGREREIDALLARIGEHPFVAVVGASGSGKSSLVAAGVIPRLQLTAGSAGEPEWTILQCTPDRLGTGDPFASLTAAVLHTLPQAQQKGLATKLRKDPQLLARLLPPRTLVFIDQFEEVFTTIQPSLRAPFVESLRHVRTIITVRADFYGNCVEMPALARLVETSTFPLSAPGMAALYEMITRPAARAALTFEDGLAQRILDDTGQEPGALALMAYTLDELYRRGLTHVAYEELGGVQGAVGKRSESVFAGLGPLEQAALPRVFRELVEIDERGTATRQRALVARVTLTSAAKRLTEALTDARLLVQSRGDGNQPFVEVAHEALFRSWTRLAEWINEAQGDLRLLRQVRNAAVEWDRSGRRDDFLWSHERLAPVYEVRDRMNVDFEPVVVDFVRPEFERIAKALRTQQQYFRQRPYIERLAAIGPTAAETVVECLQVAVTRKAQSDLYATLVVFSQASIPHLLNAIESDTYTARALAIYALIRIDASAAAHLVVRLLGTTSITDDRAAAIQLAAHAGVIEAVPVIIDALHNGTKTVRLAALTALASLNCRAALDGLLHAVLEDHMRNEALAMIATIAAGESIYEFRNLRLSDELVRLRPLITRNGILEDNDTADATAQVLTQLLTDSSTAPLPTLWRTLGHLRRPLATRALISVAVNDFPADSGHVLLAALGGTEDVAAIHAIAQLIFADHSYTRESAFQALRGVAIRLRYRMIKDEPGDLRKAILDPAVVEHVELQARGADGKVREIATELLETLRKLGGK